MDLQAGDLLNVAAARFFVPPARKAQRVKYTHPSTAPQQKINILLDCSFDIGRDLHCLSKAFARAGMKTRSDHLAKLAQKLLISAADAQIEMKEIGNAG